MSPVWKEGIINFIIQTDIRPMASIVFISYAAWQYWDHGEFYCSE